MIPLRGHGATHRKLLRCNLKRSVISSGSGLLEFLLTKMLYSDLLWRLLHPRTMD